MLERCSRIVLLNAPRMVRSRKVPSHRESISYQTSNGENLVTRVGIPGAPSEPAAARSMWVERGAARTTSRSRRVCIATILWGRCGFRRRARRLQLDRVEARVRHGHQVAADDRGLRGLGFEPGADRRLDG